MTDMPLKNFPTVGQLQGYEYLRGVITDINHVTDTCGLTAKVAVLNGEFISFEDRQYSDVPIFYHCDADKAERSNGAITGGSWAFAIGDEVTVLRQRDQAPGVDGDPKIFVIGFPDGARRCVPAIIIYATQSGLDAVAWDLVNDAAIEEMGSDYESISAALISAGVTEIDECVIDETKWACDYLSSYLFKRDDCPATGTVGANDFVNEPFYSGSYVGRWVGTSISGPGMYNSNGECLTGTYGVPYLFFTNPHPRADQEPMAAIPGPWTAYITGSLYETKWTAGVSSAGMWDTGEWGAMPYPWDQLYYINPDNGWTYNRIAIPQTYLYFRSIFDYKFDYGRVPPVGSFQTILSIPALDMAATEMFNACRDGSLRLLSGISNVVWLEANMSQASYDAMVSQDNHFMNPGSNGEVAMHPYFQMPYMIDKADGLATQGETSVLFEFCGVYPDAYEFHEDGQVWDEEKYLKYRQELRIHFRHPYPKKNMDAVLFKLVNDEREALSLKPLAWNWNLYQAAQLFSNDMATRKDNEPLHIGSDGATADERVQAASYGKYYNTSPASINSEPVLPDRGKGYAENVYGSEIGFKWPIENVVDNTAHGEEIESHTIDGIKTTITGPGWKQSEGHWAIITNLQLLETGIATRKSANGKTYITQDFGFLGDDAVWNGFSILNPEKLIDYVNTRFTFDKDPADTRRKPKVYLCTIPQA